MSLQTVGMYIDKQDLSHIPLWRQLFLRHFKHVDVSCKLPEFLTEVELKFPKADWIICAHKDFLKLLLKQHSNLPDNDPNLDDYAGSVFPLKAGSNKKVLVTRALTSLRWYTYGPFLMEQHYAKIWDEKRFLPTIPFSWEVYSGERSEELYALFQKALIISCDVETVKGVNLEDLRKTKKKVTEETVDRESEPIITESGFAGLFKTPEGKYYIHTVVIPYRSREQINFGKKLLKLPAPKVMHNGLYDCSYYLRFNQPPVNYIYDTYNLAHCTYAELPKSLGFVSCFWIREVQYWKDDREHPNKMVQYEYNAKDCYNTLCTLLNMMYRPVDWLWKNYEINFKMAFPSLNSNLYGMLIDKDEQKKIRVKAREEAEGKLARLRKMVGIENFNPGSAQQVGKLYKILSNNQAQSTEAKKLKNVLLHYPLLAIVQEAVEVYRKKSKAVSTYFSFKTMGDRLLYSIDPCGAETGRSACRASAFWCGTQIQNLPPYAKSQIITEPGWHMCEPDKEQSESRTTAYLSQDLNLIDAVENSPDFHCKNASLFFGIPFEEIYSEAGVINEKGEKVHVLMPAVRKLAKPVNHGANYNMQEYTLVETMGEKAIFDAARILKLPKIWSAMRVGAYLLQCFDKAYPIVRGRFQREIVNEIRTTGKLTLPNGWVRRCFGKPWESRQDLNSYIAHKPQSLSVLLVNEGWFDCWLNLQIRPFIETGKERIRIYGQIHDSLPFAYRVGDESVVEEVDKRMTKPLEVNGRVMIIPNGFKIGATRWSDLKD